MRQRQQFKPGPKKKKDEDEEEEPIQPGLRGLPARLRRAGK